MHPGMASHGHPNMAPNPAQHMGQPMMHPGVSGPGQPHVSQAGAMMGMQQQGANGPMGGMPGGQHPGGGGMGMPGQPGQGMGGHSLAGGGPNMPALSHMTPQQQQQLLAQQQQMQSKFFPSL